MKENKPKPKAEKNLPCVQLSHKCAQNLSAFDDSRIVTVDSYPNLLYFCLLFFISPTFSINGICDNRIDIHVYI